MKLQIPPMVEPIMARVIPRLMQMKMWRSKKALDRDPKFRGRHPTVPLLQKGILTKPADMQPSGHGADHASKAEVAQLGITLGNSRKMRYQSSLGIIAS